MPTQPNPCSGGRRRKTKGRRKTKKGGYYGFNGGLATGAPKWTAGSEMGSSSLSNRGGNSMYGAGRRRKGKKKTMRGGGKYGTVSASFEGSGSRGLANFGGVSTRAPPFGPAQEGRFNNLGAQPGSGYGSFITTSK
jgi:hypothetical protein